MLRKVDLTTLVLLAYLTTFNPTVETRVLFPKGIQGTSKPGKSSKKSPMVEKPKYVLEPVETEVMMPVQEPIVQDVQKEVVPSETGVLKRTKIPAHRPLHSPELKSIIEDVVVTSISSIKVDFVSKSKRIRKP